MLLSQKNTEVQNGYGTCPNVPLGQSQDLTFYAPYILFSISLSCLCRLQTLCLLRYLSQSYSPQALGIILNNRITHDEDHKISQLLSLSAPSRFSPNLGFPTTKNGSPLRFPVDSYLLTQRPQFLLPSPLTYSTCHLPLSVNQKYLLRTYCTWAWEISRRLANHQPSPA